MKKLTISVFFLLGAFVALFAPHCSPSPERQPIEAHRLGLGAGVRAWFDVPLSLAKSFWLLQRAIDARQPCPEQPADGAVLTYAQGCPTHAHVAAFEVPAPPSAWTYHAGSKPFQCAPGLYSFSVTGSEGNHLPLIKAHCQALQEAGAAPQECAAVLPLLALTPVSDTVHNATCAAARAEAGAERTFDDAGETDPADDFADSGVAL